MTSITIGWSGSERHLGLFRSGHRDVPVIEIADSSGTNRFVAHREHAETVSTLIQIAQHNGWGQADVDGSPEIRKAVWTAATRASFEVRGYEPTFAEREQAESTRRECVSPRHRRAGSDVRPCLDARARSRRPPGGALPRLRTGWT